MFDAIARVLQVSENQIKSVAEWAYVYHVQFVRGRSTFVSKKATKSMMSLDEAVKIIRDPQAVKRGFLDAHVIESAYALAKAAKQTASENSLKTVSIGAPSVWWEANCSTYGAMAAEANQSGLGRKRFITAEILAQHIIDNGL